MALSTTSRPKQCSEGGTSVKSSAQLVQTLFVRQWSAPSVLAPRPPQLDRHIAAGALFPHQKTRPDDLWGRRANPAPYQQDVARKKYQLPKVLQVRLGCGSNPFDRGRLREQSRRRLKEDLDQLFSQTSSSASTPLLQKPAHLRPPSQRLEELAKPKQVQEAWPAFEFREAEEAERQQSFGSLRRRTTSHIPAIPARLLKRWSGEDPVYATPASIESQKARPKSLVAKQAEAKARVNKSNGKIASAAAEAAKVVEEEAEERELAAEEVATKQPEAQAAPAQECAAVKIQSRWRGSQVRKEARQITLRLDPVRECLADAVTDESSNEELEPHRGPENGTDFEKKFFRKSGYSEEFEKTPTGESFRKSGYNEEFERPPTGESCRTSGYNEEFEKTPTGELAQTLQKVDKLDGFEENEIDDKDDEENPFQESAALNGTENADYKGEEEAALNQKGGAETDDPRTLEQGTMKLNKADADYKGEVEVALYQQRSDEMDGPSMLQQGTAQLDKEAVNPQDKGEQQNALSAEKEVKVEQHEQTKIEDAEELYEKEVDKTPESEQDPHSTTLPKDNAVTDINSTDANSATAKATSVLEENKASVEPKVPRTFPMVQGDQSEKITTDLANQEHETHAVAGTNKALAEALAAE